jgi:hypothetical protein
VIFLRIRSQYQELANTNDALSLSPLDLSKRVLAKGKVKFAKKCQDLPMKWSRIQSLANMRLTMTKRDLLPKSLVLVEDDRPDKDNDLSEDKPWSPVRHVHEEMVRAALYVAV